MPAVPVIAVAVAVTVVVVVVAGAGVHPATVVVVLVVASVQHADTVVALEAGRTLVGGHHPAIALHAAVVVLAVRVTAVTFPVLSVSFPAVTAVVIVMAGTGHRSAIGHVAGHEPDPGEVVQAQPGTDAGRVLHARIHADGLLA